MPASTPSPRSISFQGKVVGYFLRALTTALLFLVGGFHRLAFLFDQLLFPGLARVQVRKPLFVVGVPRSGTTLFHRLVASQQSVFTTPPLWELMLAPALCEKYVIWGLYRLDQCLSFGSQRGPGQRLLECSLWWFAKLTDEVHPTDLNAPEEDTLGLYPVGGCFVFHVLLAPHSKTTWDLGYFSACDEKRRKFLIRQYKQLIVRHLYFRGQGLCLLSKNPGFTAWLFALEAEFEEATFIGLRRHPRECVPSQLSSLRSGLRAFGHDPKDPQIIESFVQLLASYWRTLDRAKAELPAEKFRLIQYPDLTQSPRDIVVQALERLGYSIAAEDQQRLEILSEKASRYNSRHSYQLSEFHLTEEELEKSFPIDSTTVVLPQDMEVA